MAVRGQVSSTKVAPLAFGPRLRPAKIEIRIGAQSPARMTVCTALGANAETQSNSHLSLRANGAASNLSWMGKTSRDEGTRRM